MLIYNKYLISVIKFHNYKYYELIIVIKSMPEVIVVQYNGQFNVGIKNVRNTEYENDLIDL